MLALTSIEKAQVVDSVKCGGMIRAPYFLLSIQRPLIYLLRLRMLALTSIEGA
jgi:hypothetical protein